MTISYVRYWGSHFKHPELDRVWIALMRRICQAGWKPYLVCSTPVTDAETADKIREAGAQILYLPRARGNFDVGCMWRMYWLCKRLRCDIVHCDNMHTSPLIGAAAAGVPIRLWSKHSMNHAFETMRDRMWRDRIAVSTRTSCGLATRVLAVSSAVKGELVELGIPSSKVLVFPNAVEVRPTQGSTCAQTRAQLGYGEGETVFTTIGHAVPVKGWDVLVRAFAQVVEACPAARLQLVGSVTSSQEQGHYVDLQRYICAKGIAERVHFRGHQPDVVRILEASDVFVLPSRSEGYGRVLVEALTRGLPCIATRVGCAMDVIQQGVNGLLVARGSVQELSRAMALLATDSRRREQIARAAQAQRPYAPTMSEHADRFVEICRSLFQTRGNLVP